MSEEVVNSTTVTNFIDDKDGFDKFVQECFDMVDENGDDMLSLEEVRGGFRKLLPFGSESQPMKPMDEGMLKLIFERFDQDKNGKLDITEFKSLMTEIMNAVARGIDGFPIIVNLEKDSMLMNAIQHELVTQSSSNNYTVDQKDLKKKKWYSFGSKD
ncbi:hypothetical protein HN51_055094 [Arachis hypogaea]|uniref:EF-hand domain-containing protein n=1 Tax=Arachis hypogaea TaxID=3818 RepID=A0A6B9V8N1_ARAHY|nr:uncharacterized protein DS421_19g655640 [Arachis hypogaea]